MSAASGANVEKLKRRTAVNVSKSHDVNAAGESSDSKEKALAVQKPAPGKKDSHCLAKKTATEQLVDEVIKTACKVTGTRSLDAADRLIAQAGSALVWPKPKDTDDHLIRAYAVMAEMSPRNATEAMLATQMIAVNDAAPMFLQRATLENQSFEGTDANVLRATRLMRVFSEQLEALQKLRGKAGHQKVTVEHVHVHEGGQAIVGTVAARGQGEGGHRRQRRKHPMKSGAEC